MNQEKEAYIDKDWLTVQNYQFKILVMIAVLAENHLAYRGKLKDMCDFLGVQATTNNRNNIKDAIAALEEKKDILVVKEGQTWTLTLSVKAERKQKIIRIRNAWINHIQQHKPKQGEEPVSWENILKVFVYLIADSREVKNYETIAADLDLSTTVVKRSIYALDGIEFNEISIKRKLAWFKNNQDEFRIKGQQIDIGYEFD
jgi:hypothetical protein